MRSLGTFLAVALLIFGLVASQVFAESGKGKMGDMDRAMKADRIDKALEKEFDAKGLNRDMDKKFDAKGLDRDIDKELDAKSLDRNIDNLDAANINERFTKELEDLKEALVEGDIDRAEFDREFTELKADFLRDFKAADVEDLDADDIDMEDAEIDIDDDGLDID